MRNGIALLALFGATACFCTAAPAQEGAPTKMNFNSIPIAEKLGEAAHKILPYRSEDRVVVIVVDPIMCGQRPVNPTFKIGNGKISLHYDLTAAPVGSTLPNCAAHSTFDLDPVPHGEWVVEFSGGKETPRTAQMTRCPGTMPKFDIWDCMVPGK
jgi:hypothetical protein